MLTEAQPAYPNALTCIGTDARIQPTTWETHFCGLDIDKIEARDSVMLSPAASIKLVQGYPLELTENRKTETSYMYKNAIIDMNLNKVIYISDVVGSEFCISSSYGQRVFDAIQSEIVQGKKIRVSFRNIKSLTPAFLESAIGRLYSGMQDEIDNKLLLEDLSSVRRSIVDEVIKEAKKYYKNPDEYVANIKELLDD